VPFTLGELLAQELGHGLAEDRHLMPIATIALHSGQVEQEPAVQTKKVKGVGGDLAALVITQGVTGVLDLVAIACPNTASLQFRKGEQQIRRLALTSSSVKFPAHFTEQLKSAGGVQAIEKGTALDFVVENFVLLLKKVPTAASLAESAQEAQAEKVSVGDGGAVAAQA